MLQVEISMTTSSTATPVLMARRTVLSSVPDLAQNDIAEANPSSSSSIPAKKSRSLYPALIVGLSMVSRGEIGFLIANIGMSADILSKAAFIVTMWAILLNTILGPIAVGLIVKLLGSKLSDGMWID